MSMSDLIPWSRNRSVEQRRGQAHPVDLFRREFDRLFEDFWHGFDAPLMRAFDGYWPQLDARETDKEYVVSAELAGLEEKDVEVFVDDDTLVLRGEKRREQDGAEQGHSERYYGRFERRLRIGHDMDPDRISATLEKGVLTVRIPKTENANQRMRRIPISAR